MLEGCAAEVSYLRGAPIDLPAALAHMRREHGVRSILCEGGPSLNASLFAAGLADELFLTRVPVLAGAAGALTIIGDAPLGSRSTPACCGCSSTTARCSRATPSGPDRSALHGRAEPRDNAAAASGATRRTGWRNGHIGSVPAAAVERTIALVEQRDPLEGIAAADAHLGRAVPLPTVVLPLARWVEIVALGPGAVQVEWNLDATRPATPGRLTLYAGAGAPPERGLPAPVEHGRYAHRTAPLEEAEPELRPVHELAWSHDGLFLRLTGQGPWTLEQLVAVADTIH